MNDDNILVKDALQNYFSQYHFKDGGYTDKWFKIKAGPFFLPFPNIKARVDAVKIHDVNHLITGYKANYRGEAQIGGWELASGCGKYFMAWILNFGSFIIGMIAFPRALLTAFLSGRRQKMSLYRHFEYNSQLLNMPLGDLRRLLSNNAKRKNSVWDYLLFLAWCLAVIFCLLFTAVAIDILIKVLL
jgi:hypothetical protein